MSGDEHESERPGTPSESSGSVSNGATPVRPTPADVAQHAHPRPRSAAPTATVAPAPSSAPRPVPHAPSGPPARPAAHPRSASQPPDAGAGAGHRCAGAGQVARGGRRRTVFGIPGGAILPAYDPLMDSTTVRHILVRHEQGAGHAAEGYAAATGASASAWRPRARARPTSSPRSPTPTWTRCRWSRSPARCRARDRHRRVPGGRHPRHHDADHQAQLPGHRRRRDPARDRRGVPHRLDRPARPGARRHHQGRPAGAARRSPGRRRSTCPATAR